MNRDIRLARAKAVLALAAGVAIGLGLSTPLSAQEGGPEAGRAATDVPPTAPRAIPDAMDQAAGGEGGEGAAEPAAADAAAVRPGPEREPLIPESNLLLIVQKGGVLMLPILACSVIALAFTLERFVMLRRNRVAPRAFVDRFLARLREGKFDRASALELCRANGSPVAKVFAHGVQKWGRSSVEVEQAVLDGGEREVTHLRKNLRIINGVATVAPLLGLLGTVVGMIKAFNVIAAHQGVGKPELLADGISTALLTTAAGLTVAIPALIAYLYLVSRVDRLVAEIDAQAQQVVGLISAEGLEEQAREPRLRKREAEKVATGAG